MWPYWFMFMVPATAALLQPARPLAVRTSGSLADIRGSWFLLFLLIALLVGWRHEVGGDWFSYLRHWEESSFMTLGEALERGDPAYWLLNWLSSELDGSIYWVNISCAALFSAGVILFCRQQPRPWLALTAAIPYLVIVVGMGYTRQAVALSLCMIGLVALARNRLASFLAWVALAALFHKSAVLLIGIGMLAAPRRRRVWSVLWAGVVGLALYDAVLSESVDKLVTTYIDAEYQSEGALVRVLMNVVPAVALLVLHRRFTWTPSERALWMIMAFLALGSVVWLAVSPSSTAVDRVALYLIPLQLYVFPRLPDLMATQPVGKRMWVGLVLAYYGVVQFVWLFFSSNAGAWLPYQVYFPGSFP